MRLPQKAARRDGSIGSNTAKSRPMRIDNTPWLMPLVLLRLKYRWPLLHVRSQPFFGVLALKQ